MNEVTLHEIYDIISECTNNKCNCLKCAFCIYGECLFDKVPFEWDLEQIRIALKYLRTRADYKKGE